MQEIPQRLIVVGGVVAREAATWMSALGSDVTMLVRGSRLLSAAESFASRLIEKALAARGITVITDAQVVAAERPQASDTGLGRIHGGPVTVTCAGRTIEADEILVATGRRLLLTGMGLEVVGLEPDDVLALRRWLRQRRDPADPHGQVPGARRRGEDHRPLCRLRARTSTRERPGPTGCLHRPPAA